MGAGRQYIWSAPGDFSPDYAEGREGWDSQGQILCLIRKCLQVGV